MPSALRSLKPLNREEETSMVTGMTLPEIAEKYGRKPKTVAWWRYRYPWPEPSGKRGRFDEYDPAEVDQAVARILREPAEDADPDELLDAEAAAAEAGLSYVTVRVDISRDRWPAPDGYKAGAKAWRRQTVRDRMASRKPDRRRKPGGPEVTVTCLMLFGDAAELALEGAEDAGSTVRWPAAAIAAESGLEPGELPGRRFLVRVAEGTDGPVLSGFRVAG